MERQKTALITGAVGGIGREVVHRFARLGYKLILVDINGEQLEQLSDCYPGSITVETDLTDRKALDDLISKIASEYGQIDLAFVNAGLICVGNVLDLTHDKIDLQLELNLRSSIHLLKACAENMVAHGSGHLISTVSIGGIVALKGSATYSATKFGLRGFLTALRDELKPKGVHVSGIYPSGVDTNMLRYEAKNGGTPLNFVSAPQSIESVAEAVVKATRTKKLEIYLPYSEGVSARFISIFPWMLNYLYPWLEKIGQRGLNKYLKAIR